MANQHFFQPLLPGFHSHLTIPVAFFLKNIGGRKNEKKKVKLRSDASKISWELKLDGQRLTDGWKEFALSHDLRIGDIVIFRQENDMDFHVTIMGPSCCEIQYEENNLESEEEENNRKSFKKRRSSANEVESLSTEPESDEESSQDKRTSQERSKKNEKKGRSSRKASSSPSQNRFVTLTLKPFNVERSILSLPMPFTRTNGINEETKMSLLDKHSVKWSTDLRTEKKYKRIRMVGGWKDFFKASNVKTGESVMLKLIWEDDTSCVLKFCFKVKPNTK